MAYTAPTSVATGDAVTASLYNTYVKDNIIDHETRIKTGVESYTTTQKNALTGVSTGTVVYDSTLSQLQIWNGSAWSSELVVSGHTLITTVTATSGSTVSVNDCFSSTYENYLLVGRSKTTAGAAQTFRMRVSGTDTTSGYLYAASGRKTDNSAFTTAGSFTSAWWMPDTHNGDIQFFTVTISKPQLAKVTSFVGIGVGQDIPTGYRYAVQYGGILSDATQYTGFSIISAGTFSDFVVRVYGIRN